jgi:hypothetical protein
MQASPRLRGLALLLVSVAFLLTGCGSSDSPTAKQSPAGFGEDFPVELAGELAARSETICMDARREIKGVARGLPQRISGASGPDAIGEALVAPGIRILKRESSRLAKLEAPSNPPRFETFIGLFDPIIELSEQRLEAGQAGDLSHAHSLELVIAGLTEEQAAIARGMKLKACGVDFTEALGG